MITKEKGRETAAALFLEASYPLMFQTIKMTRCLFIQQRGNQEVWELMQMSKQVDDELMML